MKLKISESLTLLFIYTIIVSSLNRYFYWGTFNVDIFSYLSVNELVAGSISALIWVSFSLGISVIIGYTLSLWGVSAARRESHREVTLHKVLINISYFCFLIVLLYFSFNRDPLAIFGMGALIASQITPKILNLLSIDKNDTNSLLYFIIVFFVVAVPFYASGKGVIDARQIKTGTSYLAEEKTDCTKRYIGKADNLYFFYDPSDESTLHISFSNKTQLKLLLLKKFPCEKSKSLASDSA